MRRARARYSQSSRVPHFSVYVCGHGGNVKQTLAAKVSTSFYLDKTADLCFRITFHFNPALSLSLPLYISDTEDTRARAHTHIDRGGAISIIFRGTNSGMQPHPFRTRANNSARVATADTPLFSPAHSRHRLRTRGATPDIEP